MEYQFPLKELREQLEQAKAADPEMDRFGAEQHEYEWNPPADPEEVEAFEQKMGSSLPKEYRDFLLQAGNGGAGPFYGLYSLEQVQAWLDWEIEPEKAPILCPETAANKINTEGKNWKRGCIPIGSEGDTYFTCLMVTGPNRGRVVYMDYEGSWVVFPREPDFLCWYQRWLREVCNHYHIFWFGLNLDGDEQELQEYYLQAQTEAEKLDALHSMDKFSVFSPDTEAFLKNVMLERLDIEDARALLLQIHRIGSEFLQQFLEKRWQRGLYDAVVREIWYAQWHIDEDREALLENWHSAILEKLPQLSERVQVNAVGVLQRSKKVKLAQVRWVLEQAQQKENKRELLESFSKFPDAAENVDLWFTLMEEREDLELLKTAVRTVPETDDPRLRDAVLRIRKEFAFAVELIDHVDYSDEEAIARSRRRSQENAVYNMACWKWKQLHYEEINPEAEGIPRPYRLKMNQWDTTNLFLNQTPPENGIAVHPMIALAIRNQYHHLPSTAYDWEKMFDKISRLRLMLDSSTVRRWDDENRTVEIYAADEYPLPEPFYYSMEDWSAIGRMKNLKNLTIFKICVEDFSFLEQCTSLQRLSLYNTNFSDCRLLSKIPKLKSVDLGLCRLEHTEVLDSAAFSCCLKK